MKGVKRAWQLIALACLFTSALLDFTSLEVATFDYGVAARSPGSQNGSGDYENEKRKKQQEEEDKKGGKTTTQKDRPNQEKQLFVHMIPHTHDDLGWLKTVDEYYTGFNQKSQHATVSIILDSVMAEMDKRPWTKFTYVEMKYFHMWYTRQTKEVQDRLKQYVKEGRFEFLNGGWSANDEACPNYPDIINNMMMGHAFLKKEFGVVPRIAWLLDSFGHAAGNARLYADMGLEALFVGRLDYKDRNARAEKKSLNFLWRPFSKHFGSEKQMLVSAFLDHYCYPPGFYVDERYDADEPFQPDSTLKQFNGETKATELINYVQNLYDKRREQNLILPWGCDFTFANARLNYDQMDKLISYVNRYNTKNITFMYSTPSQYLDALKKENISWEPKYDDGFPYSDNIGDYWTGFFSSRPTKKKQTRDISANLHASEKLFALKSLEEGVTAADVNDMTQTKFNMLDILGVQQHHDAITGTEKQHVADEYAGEGWKQMQDSNKVYQKRLEEKLLKHTGIKTSDFEICVGPQNDTVFECPQQDTSRNQFLVVAHNPKPTNYTNFWRVRLQGNNYKPYIWSKAQKKFVETQEYDILEQFHYKNGLGDEGKNFTDYEMYIDYDLEPNEIGVIKVVKTDKPFEFQADQQGLGGSGSHLEITGFTDDNEALFKLTSKDQDFTQTFGVSLRQWRAKEVKDDKNGNIEGFAEGAYLFMPSKLNHYKSQVYAKIDPDVSYEQGRNVEQWTIRYHDWKEYGIIKVRYSPQFNDFIEFEVELNSVPIEHFGRDVTVNWRMYDNFNANRTFWTDSNGLEMQERILNFQPTYTRDSDQNISSNFYPVVSAIAMRDVTPESNKQVTILNDRTQGGSADLYGDAMIELMHNRRLRQDDIRGVEEPLNEKEQTQNGIKVTATYYMQIFDRTKGQSKQRVKQLEINQPLQYFFSFTFDEGNHLPANGIYHSGLAKYFSDFPTGAYHAFPVGRGKIQLRLENIADRFDRLNQFEQKAQDETHFFDLQNFAKDFYLEANPKSKNVPKIKITELSLSSNQKFKDNEDYKAANRWKSDDDTPQAIEAMAQHKAQESAPSKVPLGPQDIKIFEIEFGAQKQSVGPAAKPIRLQPKTTMSQKQSLDLSQFRQDGSNSSSKTLTTAQFNEQRRTEQPEAKQNKQDEEETLDFDENMSQTEQSQTAQ